MSLHQYCEHRIVVQSSDTSVYEAVRALEANHIGAVVVQDAGAIRGIVTDRDIALRVVGLELDAKQTPIRDVMTPEPTTVSVEGSEEQAIAAMRARHVRRIPIVDGERVAGIVTLDELLLTGGIDAAEAAEIVEAQLAEPAALKPPGKTRPEGSVRTSAVGRPFTGRAWRHWAHSEQTLGNFSARLRETLGWSDEERALTAFEIVASGVARRLTPGERKDFAAQLPSGIRDWLLELPEGPDLSINRASIEQTCARELTLDAESAAKVVRCLFGSLGEFVSAGELRHVASQLPADMKQLIEPLASAPHKDAAADPMNPGASAGRPSPGHKQWPDHLVREQPIQERVVVEINSQVVADSSEVIQVEEDGHPARYYFPRQAVSMSALERSDMTTQCPFKGIARYYDVSAGSERLRNAAWSYEEPYAEHAALRGRIAFHDENAASIRIRRGV